ncbi:transposase [Streptomyces zhihengii]|uniref:Transposase n=1 Tax=Streptomyces zhihengii TaxID=1818004 RepID=A0ABS2V375_9ACTN|nr:transposase [Streptomyces zhihengii]
MSLEPRADVGVLELTVQVVLAAFPKGTFAVRIREALGPLFEDAVFAGAFSARGRPAVSPGALALALVSMLQFTEGAHRPAGRCPGAGTDGLEVYLGLELDDPGFDASVLSLFRARLIEHGLEQTTLEQVLRDDGRTAVPARLARGVPGPDRRPPPPRTHPGRQGQGPDGRRDLAIPSNGTGPSGSL